MGQTQWQICHLIITLISELWTAKHLDRVKKGDISFLIQVRYDICRLLVGW